LPIVAVDIRSAADSHAGNFQLGGALDFQLNVLRGAVLENGTILSGPREGGEVIGIWSGEYTEN
jgi:hypothetical protein